MSDPHVHDIHVLPANPCIHDLVQLQAGAASHSVALVCGNRRVTYGEMNARANRLAHHLQTLGVGPDIPVGICMERCIDLPIAALAVLKAGGAYLPLDPAYPSPRLSIVLEDSETPLVITQSSMAGNLPKGKWQTILLDQDVPGRTVDSAVAPVVNIKPENLAYIVFTSGSTGRPKGVQISHASLLNLVNWHRRAF